MNLPDNWRNLGRAMLDARRREGVTVQREKMQVGAVLMHVRTYRGPADALVQVKHFQQAVSFETFSGWTGSANVSPNSAGEALRVLAALDLIPQHFAAAAIAADERYGRCQVCGRLARLWADLDTPRWVHIQPWAVTGPHAHRAEVADA